ncbi:HAD family phosphatase [Halomicroarcula sp. F13]|uniref:HAD family phosphatase n=1 Tax=Haloarcula rubra TaxID=2487747 RepID=A0AAW4PP60_9EURY|nr:HAD family phosphatase [Halomicroarcula rubra]MBX0322325.1 HAD family phosphatase [Halomicroarcula rubra]
MSDAPTAICFDMDGVLVMSEDHWVSVQRDHILPTVAPNDDIPLSAITGRDYTEVYPDIAAEYDIEVSREEYERLFEEAGERIYRDHATLLSGAHDLLADLGAAGVGLALTTSAPWDWIDVIDERFDLLSHFDAAVSAQDVDGPGKPEPGIYERGAAELGVDPGECWAVEDSTAGARAAVRAGMTTVGFRGDGDATDLSMVHHLADDADDLRTLLLGE